MTVSHRLEISAASYQRKDQPCDLAGCLGILLWNQIRYINSRLFRLVFDHALLSLSFVRLYLILSRPEGIVISRLSVTAR
jgi:hypothetical protein